MSEPSSSRLEEIMEVVTPFLPKGCRAEAQTRLMEDNLLDSVNVVQIIAELERRFAVRIGPLDMSFDDFETCLAIAAAIDRLKGNAK